MWPDRHAQSPLVELQDHHPIPHSPGELDTAAEIYEVVKDLYLKLDPERPRIRLLGVSVSSLAPGPPRRQLLLDDSGRPRGTRRPLRSTTFVTASGTVQ